MQIRPLSPSETPIFVDLWAEERAEIQRYVDLMTERRALRPGWFFVLEENGSPIGGVAYWAIPSAEKPSDFVLLNLPWERKDVVDLGEMLIRESMSQLGLFELGHVLDFPSSYPQWQQHPELRQAILERLGLVLKRETFRFTWNNELPPPQPSSRLRFVSLPDIREDSMRQKGVEPPDVEEKQEREAETNFFVGIISWVSQGTLDRAIRSEIDEYGAYKQAWMLWEELSRMEHEPSWWQIAYLEDEVVGFVMPTCSPGAGTIGYIGVVPEQRGKGFIDDLLAQGTRTLLEAGSTLINTDTDVNNEPMIDAFLHAGYVQFARRQEYALKQIDYQ